MVASGRLPTSGGQRDLEADEFTDSARSSQPTSWLKLLL